MELEMSFKLKLVSPHGEAYQLQISGYDDVKLSPPEPALRAEIREALQEHYIALNIQGDEVSLSLKSELSPEGKLLENIIVPLLERRLRGWLILPEVKIPAIIAFDFDGVLVDGNYELFHIGREVLRELFALEISEGLYPAFRDRREHAPNMRAIFELLMELAGAEDKVTSDSWERFRDLFYKRRKQMMKETPDMWAALFQPFEGVIAQIPILRQRFLEIAIISMREEVSLRTLVELFSIGIPEELVIGTRAGYEPESKVGMLQTLSQGYGLPKENVILIDDSPSNVRSALSAGYNALLATWLRGRAPEDLKDRAIDGRDIFSSVKKLILGDKLTYWDVS